VKQGDERGWGGEKIGGGMQGVGSEGKLRCIGEVKGRRRIGVEGERKGLFMSPFPLGLYLIMPGSGKVKGANKPGYIPVGHNCWRWAQPVNDVLEVTYAYSWLKSFRKVINYLFNIRPISLVEVWKR